MAQTVGAEGDRPALETVLRDAVAAAPERPEAYVRLYRIYAANGETENASAIIDQALANAPDSSALKIYKADMLLTNGDREGAYAIYEELIDVIPNNKVVVNNYISLSNQLRPDAESAQRALQHVDKIEDENNPFFQDTVGWAYYRAGQYGRAVEFLKRAAEGAPQNAEILYHLGAAKVAAGEETEGREFLQRAITEGGASFEFAAEAQSILNQ
jgi:tetratricopeptide (TPR) repeat protein